jgi:hypothetical protein
MTTWADLVMKFLNSLFDSKLKLTSLKREKRDRVADFFEQISKSLNDAVIEFKSGGSPWHVYREISYYLDDFVQVVGNTIKDDEKVLMAYVELIAAVRNDFQLLMGSRERRIVNVTCPRNLYHLL